MNLSVLIPDSLQEGIVVSLADQARAAHDTYRRGGDLTEASDPGRTRSDELLAVRCQLGEPAAFDALVERWHPALWSYVRRVSDDDDQAAELLQDTWLRVLRAMPRLRDPARLRPWLFGIARRALMDRLRDRYAAPAQEPIEAADAEASAETDDVDSDLLTMRDELVRLPVIEREVLALFYLQELTLAEVADVLAVPAGTVKSRLFRARRMLRERLTERGIQP